jgi:hypothetical protein
MGGLFGGAKLNGGVLSQATSFTAGGSTASAGSVAARADARRGVNVVFNVTTPDAASFRRAEADVSAMLARAVARGQRGM